MPRVGEFEKPKRDGEIEEVLDIEDVNNTIGLLYLTQDDEL